LGDTFNGSLLVRKGYRDSFAGLGVFFLEFLSDNSQGQSPPSRPPVPLEDVVLLINDLMLRASRFPGILPKFEWSEKAFRSFVIQLESLEGMLSSRGLFYICEEGQHVLTVHVCALTLGMFEMYWD